MDRGGGRTPEAGSGLPVDVDQLERDEGRAGDLGRAHPSGLGVPPGPGRTDVTTAFPPPAPTIEDVVRPAGSRGPVGPQPARGVAPAIAEPLATLLGQLAQRIEQGERSGPGGDEDVARAAVAVAKAIVELASPPGDQGHL
jgi:hypothetical protein